jgi:hypothetical protein
MSDSRVYDLFISYAHLDNQPISEEHKGWISNFHYSLDVRLSQLLGRKPLIWRDNKLHGNDEFKKEIELKFFKTKIFLAVISPCYMQSEWCMKEMRAFIKEAGAREGVQIGRKSRIFKIVKTFVPHEQHPVEIQGLLGYEFFLKDERGRWREFNPEKGARFHQEFLEKLDDVSCDICELIKEMERENLKDDNHDVYDLTSPEDSKNKQDIFIPGKKKSLLEFSVEDLDRELIARAVQIPPNEIFKFKDKGGTPQRDAIVEQLKRVYQPTSSPSLNETLRHISTFELAKILILMTRNLTNTRGIWFGDDRMDFFEIQNEQVKKSADCVAAILNKNGLINNKGFSILKVKNYGKSFNLADSEPFHEQPIAAGRLFTGFLVRDDVIATAGQCTNERNVKDLRIVFGFKMIDSSTPMTKVPNENVYKGVKIIDRVYNPNGNMSDWALVKLDRKVLEQSIAPLSRQDISVDQPLYVIGHPVGLPLKYAPGAWVRDVKEAYFAADLDVYCGNSGSPVFKSDTHEVIGIVVRGHTQDFRWTGKGWASIIYPNSDKQSPLPECTRVSEFIDIVDRL